MPLHQSKYQKRTHTPIPRHGLPIKKQIPQAAQQYDHALTIDPDIYAARMNLAGILQDNNRYDEAIQHYKEAARIRPNDFLPLLRMANTMTRNGDPENSRIQAKKAAQLNPTDPNVIATLNKTSPQNQAQ